MNELNIENLWLIILVILSGVIGFIFLIIISKSLDKDTDEKNIIATELGSTYIKPANAIGKRLFDIIFSIGIILFVMSYLYPLMAIIIRLTSKGPVLIKRPIIGQFGKLIYVYQFRTGYKILLNCKEIVVLTDIGRFLRKTSLDEMPKFFNVLSGNISVVGRSREYCFLSKLQELDEPTKSVILSLKPGIVSLKSVLYTDKKASESYRFDLTYAYTQNIIVDYKIIIKAYLRLLVNTGDY